MNSSATPQQRSNYSGGDDDDSSSRLQLCDVIRTDMRVVVQRGRSVYLRPSDLFLDTGQPPRPPAVLTASRCRVQVKQHEAVSELTGQLHPRVSDVTALSGQTP